MNNDKAGPKIKDISGYMIEKDSKFVVLEGSGSISPEFHLNQDKELQPKTIDELNRILKNREELILKGEIIEMNEKHGFFQNDVTFNSISAAGRMVRGAALSGRGEWRRKSDNEPYYKI